MIFSSLCRNHKIKACKNQQNYWHEEINIAHCKLMIRMRPQTQATRLVSQGKNLLLVLRQSLNDAFYL